MSESTIYNKTIEDMLQFNDYEYDFRNVPYVSNSRYIFVDENKSIATRDILHMNDLWIDACIKAPELPQFIINEEDIIFEPTLSYDKTRYDIIHFTHFTCVPYTSTRKIRKYQMEIRFTLKDIIEHNTQKYFTGVIEYLSDGTIGKVELILFYRKNINSYDFFDQSNHIWYHVKALKTNMDCAVNNVTKSSNMTSTRWY